jgi:predicted CXXCH cytochrome family protein
VAANASPWRRFGLHAGDGDDATIVNPARLPAGRASEVCGQCHGIGCPPDDWLQRGIGFRPGQSLAGTKPILRLATLASSACGAQIAADQSFATTRYWRDGMVRVSGREYNGVLESSCAADARFGCLSCHSMHDSDPEWQLVRGQDDRSNAACARCHPAIAGNVAAHSHHPASSTGAICYNCHMPHTTYGLLRAMRSHQVSVPRVADTVATGRPNACNLCHADRPLGWTATALQRWYGTAAPSLTPEQRTLAASLVEVARGDAGVRALWAWSLGWAPARAVAGGGGNAAALTALLIELLDDDYAAVRAIAARSLGAWDGFGDWRFDYVAPREARWAAQAEARRRAARLNGQAARPALLIDDDGRFARGELERLMAGRDDDDQMFLAE